MRLHKFGVVLRGNKKLECVLTGEFHDSKVVERLPRLFCEMNWDRGGTGSQKSCPEVPLQPR